ncbi:MAG: calcium/sodium antiporter [Spirochaetales bacterium]|nr:calcium/sodium antiporter [Spirochaetales bacterium]
MFAWLEPVVSSNWATAVLGLVAGIGLLWISSEAVIRNITPIARFFGVKELVITILGVSVFSSMPELVVSLLANARGKSDISLGNIVGSNFVTLTFVTALCAFIMPITVRDEVKEREAAWMILSTAIIFLLAIDGVLSRIDGFILMGLYTPYLISVIREAIRESRATKTAEEGKEGRKRPNIFIPVLIGLLGIAGIIGGAEITLQSGQTIGKWAGIPDLALGVILFALGTSLPELAIALSATFKKKADVSIGEIYASNIFTAMFVLGLCCIINPMENLDPNILRFDLPFLVLTGIVIQIFITTNKKLVRMEAAVIFILYIYFVLGHFFNLSFSF